MGEVFRTRRFGGPIEARHYLNTKRTSVTRMEVSWRLAREITVLDLAGAFAVSSEDTEIESLRSAVQTLIAQAVCVWR